MSKIMLVEDDNNLREIYEARLQAEGYVIVSAKDGEEALVLAKNENPDLIIADVMMPKVSGFEMLDILRNTDGLKDAKIIMLTALGQSEDQQRANRLGADRYLVKSQVTLEDIVKVAHELLNDIPKTVPEIVTEPVMPAPEVAAVAAPAAETPVMNSEPAMPAIAPVAFDNTPVAPAAEPLVAQTTAQEEAEMKTEIENFVDSNTAPIDNIPVQVNDAQSNDNQVMDNAINSLMENTEQAPAPEPVMPMAPVQSAPADPSVPVLITPTVPIVDGNVPIANKKIISPLDVEPTAPKTDINVLFAQEEANNAAPEQPAPTPEPAQPFDPNNIAL